MAPLELYSRLKFHLLARMLPSNAFYKIKDSRYVFAIILFIATYVYHPFKMLTNHTIESRTRDYAKSDPSQYL